MDREINREQAIKKSVHKINNELAIIDAYFAVANTDNMNDGEVMLYQNARQSLQGVVALVRGIRGDLD